MKIVIVDDDKAMRAVLRSVYEGEGHGVVAEFGDGIGLLEHVMTNHPDVVCLDNLPGANGLELLVEMDTTANHVDVIMITDSDDPELKGHAAALGAHGFIHKPFEQVPSTGAIGPAVAWGDKRSLAAFSGVSGWLSAYCRPSQAESPKSAMADLFALDFRQNRT